MSDVLPVITLFQGKYLRSENVQSPSASWTEQNVTPKDVTIYFCFSWDHKRTITV